MAHKTRSGASSNAWRELEKTVAERLRKAGFRRAKRILLSGHDKRTLKRPDVDVPEIRSLAIDTKYQVNGWHHHSVFLDEVDKYVGLKRLDSDNTYTWSIMPTRAGGSKDILVTLRLEHFLDLLNRAYLRQPDGHWTCLRCPGTLNKTSEFLGLYRYHCEACGLELLSREEEGEAHQHKARPSKNRGEVIKDRTADRLPDSEFKPHPRQLTVADLIKRKDRPARRRKRRKQIDE